MNYSLMDSTTEPDSSASLKSDSMYKGEEGYHNCVNLASAFVCKVIGGDYLRFIVAGDTNEVGQKKKGTSPEHNNFINLTIMCRKQKCL
jgi:hypothetical protein